MTAVEEAPPKSVAQLLREPFDASRVGKLPRVKCGDCSDKDKRCDKHVRAWCDTCKSLVSEDHMHIDFVGHADVTDRLLQVDPSWGWDPQERDVDPDVLKAAIATGDLEIIRMVIKNSPPKFEEDNRGNPVGLWITLTVGGLTMPGYGSCPSNQRDAVKVLIGDAIRNAAYRLGVALDQWRKGDLDNPSAENATASASSPTPRRARQQPRQPQQEGPKLRDDGDVMKEYAPKIEQIACGADGERLDRQLQADYRDETPGRAQMSSAAANAVRTAIKQRMAAVEVTPQASRPGGPEPLPDGDPWGEAIDAAGTAEELDLLAMELNRSPLGSQRDAQVRAHLNARRQTIGVPA